MERVKAEQRCPDDGWCHHECGPEDCFRVWCCEPLSDVYPGDVWPADVLARFDHQPERLDRG